MTINLHPIEYFRFEEDFVEDNVRCIPMIVRFKLDACGVKLKLTEWSKMTPSEREHLAALACETDDETLIYQRYLKHLVWHRTGGEATPLQVQANPAWSVLSTLPELLSEKLNQINHSISLQQWQRLSVLQRFALLKLSSGGHEHKNFQKALEEFELI